MKVYTYSETRQHLATVLEEAQRDGVVRVRRKDGLVFVIKPEPRTGSPLEVAGVSLDLTAAEIVDYIRESRSRGEG